MKALIVVGLLVGSLFTAECAITNWTNPAISVADGSGAATPSVAEDTSAGTNVITVEATTASAYTLTAQSPAGPPNFTIANSGEISFTGTLDYEITTEFVLTIEADDGSSNKGTASVTVSISDVNDNNPAFASTSKGYTVCNGATASTTVATLTATDADVTAAYNTISSYSISDGNTNTDFAVSSAGKITVAKTLDKATTAGYALTLQATDGTNTGTMDVFVVVTTCSSAVAVFSSMMMILGMVITIKAL